MDARARSIGDLMILLTLLVAIAFGSTITGPALRRTPLPVRTMPIGPAGRRARRQRGPRPSQTTSDGQADMVLLIAVGLLSGLSVSLTCRQIARTVDSPEASMLAAAVERQRRGQPLLEALHESTSGETAANRGSRRLLRTASRSDETDAMTRTVALLRSQVEDGAAVAEALLELSMSLRDDARRQAELQARRLPVRMLLPLIACVLPGFLCLTVAPVILDSLRGVAI